MPRSSQFLVKIIKKTNYFDQCAKTQIENLETKLHKHFFYRLFKLKRGIYLSKFKYVEPNWPLL